MWTIISGYIISIVFDYSVTKLHFNNFSNKNMTLLEIVIGWLFQEHVRQDFNMTGGKRFMLKKDFRNRFITQSIKIIRNIIFWVHVVNILELGTLLFFLIFLLYIIFTRNFFFKIKTLLLQNFKMFATFSIFPITKRVSDCLIESALLLILLGFYLFIFFRTYSLFDFIFIIKPFFIMYVIVLSFMYLYFGICLIYSYILNNFSIKFGGIIKITTYKLSFYTLILYLLVDLLINVVSSENLITENFFKELLLKLLFFYQNTNDYY